MSTAARNGRRIATTVLLLLLSRVALATAQEAPRVRGVVFAEIEKRIDAKTQLPCFVLLDDDTTDPQSQIVVSLSALPDSAEDGIPLLVWLVDSKGDSVKVRGIDRDTIMPWELVLRSDSSFHDVDWAILRPSRPGRGVFRLRAILAASKTPRETRPFVLQLTDCEP